MSAPHRCISVDIPQRWRQTANNYYTCSSGAGTERKGGHEPSRQLPERVAAFPERYPEASSGRFARAAYYIRPSQAGLEAFFTTVADATCAPLVLYDIPYRTGVAFEQATLLNIVNHERIVAIKDCGGNMSNTLALLASGKVDVLCGEDNKIFNALCLGAKGAIAASAHVHPEHFVDRYQQISDNQLAASRKIFFKLLL